MCGSLSGHLGGQLDDSIPEPTEFLQSYSDLRQVMYYYLNGKKIRYYQSKTMKAPEDDILPQEIKNAVQKAKNSSAPTNLEENVALFGRVAEIVFKKCGNHMPMLFFFDDQFKPIDFITTAFEVTADKYVFWRGLAERIMIKKPYSLIWISEAWKRNMDNFGKLPIRKLEIAGEVLDVCGLDRSGCFCSIFWEIMRDNLSGTPRLVYKNQKKLGSDGIPNFLLPAAKAMGINR